MQPPGLLLPDIVKVDREADEIMKSAKLSKQRKKNARKEEVCSFDYNPISSCKEV